jgi:hypothetical protein
MSSESGVGPANLKHGDFDVVTRVRVQDSDKTKTQHNSMEKVVSDCTIDSNILEIVCNRFVKGIRAC